MTSVGIGAMLALPENDLVAHELCLGTNVFGWSADKSPYRAVLKVYMDRVGNFINQ
jgi:aryl-alcohol dehydrogenase-like predicted oxidoreductase